MVRRAGAASSQQGTESDSEGELGQQLVQWQPGMQQAAGQAQSFVEFLDPAQPRWAAAVERLHPASSGCGRPAPCSAAAAAAERSQLQRAWSRSRSAPGAARGRSPVGEGLMHRPRRPQDCIRVCLPLPQPRV